MADLITKILSRVEMEAKQEEHRPTSKGLYRASSLGKCGRAIQYAALGYKSEALSPAVHMIFRDGHMHHEDVRDLLGKVGLLTNIEQTVSKEYKHKGSKFVLTGTMDGVFDGDIVDIKSMSTYPFKYLDKNFPSEYRNYVWQITIYMDITGKKKSFIIFKDKNSGEWAVKWVYYDPKIMEEILDHVAEIHKGIKTKTLMKRPYKRNNWLCKKCQFRLPCWKLAMERKQWAREGTQDRSGSPRRGKREETG